MPYQSTSSLSNINVKFSRKYSLIHLQKVKLAMKKHFKIGLPIIAMTIAGSLMMSQIYGVRLDIKNEKKDLRIKKGEKFDIQKAYFDLMKQDFDDWDYVPVNRD
jgi:hypothetical protein